MARVPHNQWPEVVFVGDQSRAVLSQAAKDGRAVRLGPGIYTPLASAPPEETVRRNWAQILDHELPGAIITDRSARHSGPVDGYLIPLRVQCDRSHGQRLRLCRGRLLPAESGCNASK